MADESQDRTEEDESGLQDTEDDRQRAIDLAAGMAAAVVGGGAALLMGPLGPLVAFPLSGAAALAAQGVVKKVSARRDENLMRFHDLLAEGYGAPIAAVFVEAQSDPRNAELLAQAWEYAARSLDDRKLAALARVVCIVAARLAGLGLIQTLPGTRRIDVTAFGELCYQHVLSHLPPND